MTHMVTAPLTGKGQLTVPKRVRQWLKVGAAGDRIGFLIDERTRRVTVTKVELIPAEEPYTDEEIRKLLKLRKGPGKTFDSAEAFLKHLHSL